MNYEEQGAVRGSGCVFVVQRTVQVALAGIVLAVSGCMVPPDYHVPRGFSRTYRDKLYAQPDPPLRDYAAEEVHLPPFTPKEEETAPASEPEKPVESVEYLTVDDPLFMW